MAETDKETANVELYQFLKNARTDKDLSNIMLALEKSLNTAAHDIFKQNVTKSDVQTTNKISEVLIKTVLQVFTLFILF